MSDRRASSFLSPPNPTERGFPPSGLLLRRAPLSLQPGTAFNETPCHVLLHSHVQLWRVISNGGEVLACSPTAFRGSGVVSSIVSVCWSRYLAALLSSAMTHTFTSSGAPHERAHTQRYVGCVWPQAGCSPRVVCQLLTTPTVGAVQLFMSVFVHSWHFIEDIILRPASQPNR